MKDYAEMVLEWAQNGYTSEVDLFITRPTYGEDRRGR